MISHEEQQIAKLVRRRSQAVLKRYASRRLMKVLMDVQTFGDIAIFGGLLRDMALHSARRPVRFRSDVDVVIDVDDPDALGVLALRYGARRNRFGGYRLFLQGGSVDLWSLRQTWAFQSNTRATYSFADLLTTTYFSWDSIVYVLGPIRRGEDSEEDPVGSFLFSPGKLIVTPGYFSSMRAGIVDLQMADNPNPIGALVRTIRLLLGRNASLGRRLAENTLCLFDMYGPSEILLAEQKGFDRPILRLESVQRVKTELRRYMQHDVRRCGFRLSEQLPLASVSEWIESPSPS